MSLTRLLNVIILGISLLMILAFVAINLPIFLNIGTKIQQPLVNESGTGSLMNITENWDTYINYDYKYIFSYPSGATIENITLNGYITDLEKYNGVHSDDICVKIKYGLAWMHIYVNPRDPNITKFCGKYQYDSSVPSERKQIQVAGKTYSGLLIQKINENIESDFKEEELYVLIIPNGDIDLRIEYGSTAVLESRKGKTKEDYYKDKAVIEEILNTFELI